jgi:hypothetical protein
MGLLVITMGPAAEARGMKDSPGPKPNKESTMNEVMVPLENLSVMDGEEMTEPSVGDTVELTGEVTEIRDGKAVVRVVEAETEAPEAEEEATAEPTLEEEGAALRKLAEQEDMEA